MSNSTYVVNHYQRIVHVDGSDNVEKSVPPLSTGDGIVSSSASASASAMGRLSSLSTGLNLALGAAQILDEDLKVVLLSHFGAISSSSSSPSSTSSSLFTSGLSSMGALSGLYLAMAKLLRPDTQVRRS